MTGRLGAADPPGGDESQGVPNAWADGLWLVLSDGAILDVAGSRSDAESFADLLAKVNEAVGRVTLIEVVDGSCLDG